MADASLVAQLQHLKQYVVQSQKTLISYQEEFFIGQRDLIDLLDAQNESNSAQNSYTQAYFDSLLARYRILEGSGRLFAGIGLNPEIGEDDFRVARIVTNQRDELPLDWDRDNDTHADQGDHCDNSRHQLGTNDYGCEIPDKPEARAEMGGEVQPVDDVLQVQQNGVLIINPDQLLKNDSEGASAGLQIKAFTQPAYGLLELDGNRQLVYRAADGFIGEDVFTYSIADEGAGKFARVKINVVANTAIDFSKTYYVRYHFNRIDLTNYSAKMAEQVIAALKQRPEMTVSIVAYTDDVGSDAYNQDLSDRRAAATRKMLIDKGIAADRIKVQGGGESNPLADNRSKEGRAINRRGEFRFYTTGATR